MRPGLVLASLVAAAGAGFGVRALVEPRAAPEGPVAVPVPNAPASEIGREGSARLVLSRAAPERLLLDSAPPRHPVQLLWLEGRTAAPTMRGALVLDGAGGVLAVDSRLRVRRLTPRLEGRELLSVAPSRDNGAWATAATGEVLRLTPEGEAQVVPGLAFPYASVAASRDGSRAWLVRSSERFGFRWDSAASPVALPLGSGGVRLRGVGLAHRPEHVLLGDLANAGQLAVGDQAVFYAPFIRDEVIAFAPNGDTLWVARRDLPQSRGEPKFELQGGRPVIDYHPVNLGMTLGLDGRLYLLSTPGFSTTTSRLDVFDPASGRLLRSVVLATATPTLAVDADGRVYRVDPVRLLSGIPPQEREAFPAFVLDQLGGGELSSEVLSGRVTLVNFWASWCLPCRTEMPALDSLRRAVTDRDFQFLTFNEDVNPADAATFMRELHVDFPVLLGRGQLQAVYHYVGLPYTVLIDREGRLAGRWVGFAGPEQIAAIRGLIQAELARPGEATASETPAAGPEPHHH